MKSVLVVDDSALMRKIISNTIVQDGHFNVIGTACSGEVALEKIRKHKPDIITLDITLPGIDGIAVLKRIMKEFPIPVIVVSSHAAKDSVVTLRALEAGAVDFVVKPKNINFKVNYLDFKEEIIKKLKEAGKSNPQGFVVHRKKLIHKFSSKVKKILLIGASTGGPSTLHKLFSELPGELPFPILVVQHMPKDFTKTFADRLNKVADFEVKEAEDGELLKDNVAYLCPGDYHMLVKCDEDTSENYITLTKTAKVNNVRPSYDVLLESAAPLFGRNIVMVILTGMGKDGFSGAKLIKKEGGLIIAESEESCVVYGMPKAVIEDNLADLVVNLELMPVSIIQKIED